MFMGVRAFAYYFPVIEDYLRTVPDAESDDDHEAWVLARCIQAQFVDDNLTHVRHLGPRVIQLAAFVRENLRRFGADEGERQRVADAWAELVRHVEASDEP